MFSHLNRAFMIPVLRMMQNSSHSANRKKRGRPLRNSKKKRTKSADPPRLEPRITPYYCEEKIQKKGLAGD